MEKNNCTASEWIRSMGTQEVLSLIKIINIFLRQILCLVNAKYFFVITYNIPKVPAK